MIASAHGVFGYGDPPDGLVETVVGTCADEWGWTVEPELAGLAARTGQRDQCHLPGRRKGRAMAWPP